MNSLKRGLVGGLVAGAVWCAGGCAGTGAASGGAVVFTKSPEPVTRMYQLMNMDAREAGRIAGDVNGVAATWDVRTNTLFIKGMPADVEAAEAMIKKLDAVPAEEELESTVMLVYPLKFAQADKLCALLKESMKARVEEHSGVPLWVASDERTNSLVVMIESQDKGKLRELLAELDVQVAGKR